MCHPLQPTPASGRLRPLLVGGILVLGLVQFGLHYLVTVVVGTSMVPTFATGDLLLVDKHAYDNAPPQRGDVVICRSGRELLVKRVVGLPREELEMVAGILLVNGAQLREPYVAKTGNHNIGPGTLPDGNVVVMGDNRALTPNQFVFALVPFDQIVGKVIHSLRFHAQPRALAPRMTARTARRTTVALTSRSADFQSDFQSARKVL